MPTLVARFVLPVIVTLAVAAVTSMIVMISNDDEKKRQERLKKYEPKDVDV